MLLNSLALVILKKINENKIDLSNEVIMIRVSGQLGKILTNEALKCGAKILCIDQSLEEMKKLLKLTIGICKIFFCNKLIFVRREKLKKHFLMV